MSESNKRSSAMSSKVEWESYMMGLSELTHSTEASSQFQIIITSGIASENLKFN